jgi:hypothetical protein
MGVSSGKYTQTTDVGNKTTDTITVNKGSTYYFVVTAYNSNGTDGMPSNEVSVTVQ